MMTATLAGRRQADTVVVIESDETARDLIRTTLKKAGYRIVEAGSGEDASVHLGTHRSTDGVHAILCDIRTPRIKGVEATLYFRARYPGIPVIVTADYADIEWAITLMKRGATDYLVKPISKDDLLVVLKAALRQTVLAGRYATGLGRTREIDGRRSGLAPEDGPEAEVSE